MTAPLPPELPRFDRIVLDVGANDGRTTLPLARRNPATLVIAFEPTPELAESLRRASADLPNYLVVEAAVDETEGEADFNVAPVGTGSLQTMTPEEARRGWLEGVEVTDRIRVRVVRLDRALRGLGIARVDYLHCDAQGSDLRVLRSLGDLLPQVEAGVIEVPARTRLYGTGHSAPEAIEFLLQAGFRPTRVIASDVGGHEHNLYFKRTARRSRYSRAVYRAWFAALRATAEVWVVPARGRVKVAARTRLKRIVGGR